MIFPTGADRRLLLACSAVLLGIVALVGAARPAEARGWFSFSAPYPAYYYPPGPYYGYAPAPAPYAYAPPADYGYPAYPAPAVDPAPSAYSPPDYDPYAPQAYAPAASGAIGQAPAATTSGRPAITYTNKPAFTNAAGQTCRQYKTTDTTNGRPVDVYGTACRAADGQWRVAD